MNFIWKDAEMELRRCLEDVGLILSTCMEVTYELTCSYSCIPPILGI